MGIAFSLADAQLAKYWYERRIYTWGPQSLAATTTAPVSIFSAQGWQDATAPRWEAALTGLWVTANADVSLSWQADDVTYNQASTQGFTDAGPADLQRIDVYAPATRLLNLTASNSSGAAIAGFQINYEITLRRLSAADHLAAKQALSPKDQQALAMLNGTDAAGNPTTGLQRLQAAVKEGSAPIPLLYQIARTLRGRQGGDDARGGLYHVDVPTTPSAFATIPVAPRTLSVLTEIAAPTAPAATTLYVDRDLEDAGLLTLNAAAFAQTNPQAPWRTWIPATQQLNFRSSATAAANGVPIMVRVETFSLSDLWLIKTELAKEPGDLGTSPDLWADVWAGLA